MPESAASVTAKALGAVEAGRLLEHDLVLVGMPSRILCRPLLRSMAGEAPDCALQVDDGGAIGNIFER